MTKFTIYAETTEGICFEYDLHLSEEYSGGEELLVLMAKGVLFDKEFTNDPCCLSATIENKATGDIFRVV